MILENQVASVVIFAKEQVGLQRLCVYGMALDIVVHVLNVEIFFTDRAKPYDKLFDVDSLHQISSPYPEFVGPEGRSMRPEGRKVIAPSVRAGYRSLAKLLSAEGAIPALLVPQIPFIIFDGVSL
jgi:hypothetical protein